MMKGLFARCFQARNWTLSLRPGAVANQLFAAAWSRFRFLALDVPGAKSFTRASSALARAAPNSLQLGFARPSPVPGKHWSSSAENGSPHRRAVCCQRRDAPCISRMMRKPCVMCLAA
eukprot:CAMPEP_0181362866 /NCGR_PEP_ID=MMETSP1106-20121128/8327_1 /TAXON_ID=81844 /ORGANISM="Mantoniella antarctica, Strain SL-175" /LENGTH=117 /DNA_ID=CAMNT_0023477033 /DNA_START=734 /DNA_END=1088 /DNA_ORIENTATION=+